MLRRLVVLFVLGLLVISILAGCGKKEEPAMEETTPTEQPAATDTATMTDTAAHDTAQGGGS